MNKQSSVEWYSNEIGKITADALSGKMTGLEWSYLQKKALQQAQAMEKKQCVDFALKCMLNGLEPHQSTREVVKRLFDEGLQ